MNRGNKFLMEKKGKLKLKLNFFPFFFFNALKADFTSSAKKDKFLTDKKKCFLLQFQQFSSPAMYTPCCPIHTGTCLGLFTNGDI